MLLNKKMNEDEEFNLDIDETQSTSSIDTVSTIDPDISDDVVALFDRLNKRIYELEVENTQQRYHIEFLKDTMKSLGLQ